MTWSKSKRHLVDNITKKHTDVASEMIEGIFHNINSKFPELNLSELEETPEELVSIILEIGKGRK